MKTLVYCHGNAIARGSTQNWVKVEHRAEMISRTVSRNTIIHDTMIIQWYNKNTWFTSTVMVKTEIAKMMKIYQKFEMD